METSTYKDMEQRLRDLKRKLETEERRLKRLTQEVEDSLDNVIKMESEATGLRTVLRAAGKLPEDLA